MEGGDVIICLLLEYTALVLSMRQKVYISW